MAAKGAPAKKIKDPPANAICVIRRSFVTITGLPGSHVIVSPTQFRALI